MGSELLHNIIHAHLVAYIVEGKNWDHLKQYAPKIVPRKYCSGLEYVNDKNVSIWGMGD